MNRKGYITNCDWIVALLTIAIFTFLIILVSIENSYSSNMIEDIVNQDLDISGFTSDTIEDYCGNQGNFIKGYMLPLPKPEDLSATNDYLITLDSDAAIVFDGNARDFHIGLDDTTDDLVIDDASDYCLTITSCNTSDITIIMDNDCEIKIGESIIKLKRKVKKLNDERIFLYLFVSIICVIMCSIHVTKFGRK